MKPHVMTEIAQNTRFLSLVRKIDEYLLKNQTAKAFGQSAESLERDHDGNPYIQKKLGNGIRIRGTLMVGAPIVTLQIFLDPLRFQSWTKALGPVEVFYMDPYGIEIFHKEGWHISLDGEPISLRNTEEIHEIARIEVREEKGQRRIIRTR